MLPERQTLSYEDGEVKREKVIGRSHFPDSDLAGDKKNLKPSEPMENGKVQDWLLLVC